MRKGSDRKSIRIPDTAAWEHFGTVMDAAGTDRSAAIRAVVAWLNREAEVGPDAVRRALHLIGMRLPGDDV